MSNLKPTALAAGAAALATGAALVYACGVYFPMQLLDNRAATLHGTPSNSFDYEAAHLVTPDNALTLPASGATGTTDTSGASGTLDTHKVLVQGLSAPQAAVFATLAEAADGDAAYALGAGLPEPLRLQAAASVDLARADAPCPGAVASDGHPAGNAGAVSGAVSEAAPAPVPASTPADTRATDGRAVPARACPDPDTLMRRATARLEAALALPAARDTPVALIAADQLAQLASDRAQQCGVGAACATSLEAAHRAFARVRTLAVRGASDPLGIAVGSYGDEALLDLRNARTGEACNWLSFANVTACADAVPAAALKRAIGRYAQQAARGSNIGFDSLMFIAGWALTDAQRAGKLIDDAVAQRLLVGYALAREGDVVGGDPATASAYHGGWDTTIGPTGYQDVARGGGKTAPNARLVALVDAIQARGLTQVGRADQLASLAYRTGHYALAASLLASPAQSSALANWVRAKLALRNGDTDAALRDYAAAARAFPDGDASIEPASAQLIEGERGVLTLARGQYVEALSLFYAAAQRAAAGTSYEVNYAGDMAYVAERVLSTDELKTFVDAQASASTPPAPSADPKAPLPGVTTADTLRYLLARRLVRDGRIDEAVPYFPQDGDPRFSETIYDDKGQAHTQPNAYRALAQRYGALLHTARDAWFDTSRAQAWFAAAGIAKQYGMELMGYEQEPDYTDVGGMTSGNSGRNRTDAPMDLAQAEAQANAPAVPAPDTPAARVKAALPGPFVTDGERARYLASESRPFMRFHYRGIAADEVQHAADLLPPRSQAYAAVLCQGALWTLNDDPARAAHFYRQYVAHGAYVNFGGAPFGLQCPAPDFRAARDFRWVQAWRGATGFVRTHRKPVVLTGAAGVLLIAGAAVWGWRRRKARQAAQHGAPRQDD